MTEVNLDTWMGDLRVKLISKPLNQIVMPGSHNSGTYGVVCQSKVSPDSPTKLLALVPCIGVKLSKCQSLDIIGQLDAGVRLFDLRVATDGNGVEWLCHSLYSVRLSDAFKDFGVWLDNHLYEVVILMVGFINSPNVANLVSLVGAERVAPPDLTPLSPIDLFWTKNKRCVIADWSGSSPSVWDANNTIISSWPNKQDVSALKTWLDTNIPTNYTNNIYVSQVILTPTFATVLKGDNPKTSSLQIDTALSGWLNRWTANGNKLNVIMVDFAGGDLSLMGKIISLN